MPEQTLVQKAQCAATNQVPDDGPLFDFDVLNQAVAAAVLVVLEDLHGYAVLATRGDPVGLIHAKRLRRAIEAEIALLERSDG